MTKTPTDKKQELRSLIQDFDNAMLSTHAPDGSIHARPMALAELDAEGRLWFVTSKNTTMAGEILKDPRAAVTLQSPGKHVALSGKAMLVDDDVSLHRVWSPRFEPWFEDESKACLICLTPARGEYWKQGAVDAIKMKLEELRSQAGGPSPSKNVEHAQLS